MLDGGKNRRGESPVFGLPRFAKSKVCKLAGADFLSDLIGKRHQRPLLTVFPNSISAFPKLESSVQVYFIKH